MALVTFTYTHTNGEIADADEVMSNFNQINNSFPLAGANIAAGAITSSYHGNCTATSGSATHHAARQVVVNDASGLFTTDNVEAALAQVGAATLVPTGATAGPPIFVGRHTSGVVVPANTFSQYVQVYIVGRGYQNASATSAWLVTFDINSGTAFASLAGLAVSGTYNQARFAVYQDVSTAGYSDISACQMCVIEAASGTWNPAVASTFNVIEEVGDPTSPSGVMYKEIIVFAR